ncbi:MAG: glycosyltransferase family 2 protein [Candidatus Latescibacteria bacterium]|nr:glycosyltransferase family 2 protein [Candidatus Latescibacterota bacterium]
MIRISAVIITLNEERNIGRCIDSLRDVADEVIVVDSFSTDKTGEICKSKGVHFIQKEWEGYSKTKNYANQQASFEYILSLDADEALSEELINSIKREKEKELDGIYCFNRLTNYCGKWIKHCGWYPDVKTRLFPKNIAAWEGDYVHEEIKFIGESISTHLKGDLLHYPYYSIGEHYERVEKYSLLGARKLLDKNKGGFRFKGIFSAISRFVRMYFLKLGILDGRAGYRICRISAYAAYLKYVKLNEIKKETG